MPDTGNRAPGAPRPAADGTASSDTSLVEINMRRALGLTGGGNGRSAGPVIQQRPDQARQRHRFAQDGSVAVTVLNHRPDELAAKDARIRELQASIENERNQHAATRRALGEQQAAVQAMQTRMAHMELAHRDVLEAERRALTVARNALIAARDSTPRRSRPATVVADAGLSDAGTSDTGTSDTGTSDAATSGDAVPDPTVAEPGTDEPVVHTGDATGDTMTVARTAPVTADAAPKAKRGRPRIHPPREAKPVRWWTPSYKAKSKI